LQRNVPYVVMLRSKQLRNPFRLPSQDPSLQLMIDPFFDGEVHAALMLPLRFLLNTSCGGPVALPSQPAA